MKEANPKNLKCRRHGASPNRGIYTADIVPKKHHECHRHGSFTLESTQAEFH